MKNIIIALLLITLLVLAGWLSYNKYFQPKTSLIAHVTYLCQDSKTIDARYYQGPLVATKPNEMPVPYGSVALILSDGREMTLPQTISASGIRYANTDESFIFWSKGDGAFITENNNETFSGCLKK